VNFSRGGTSASAIVAYDARTAPDDPSLLDLPFLAVQRNFQPLRDLEFFNME
jgi:hypothetical protein